MSQNQKLFRVAQRRSSVLIKLKNVMFAISPIIRLVVALNLGKDQFHQDGMQQNVLICVFVVSLQVTVLARGSAAGHAASVEGHTMTLCAMEMVHRGPILK